MLSPETQMAKGKAGEIRPEPSLPKPFVFHECASFHLFLSLVHLPFCKYFYVAPSMPKLLLKYILVCVISQESKDI